MLKEDLVNLVYSIQKIEAEEQQVEVKAAREGCPTRLYDTLSAFSNQDKGGIIVFGLDEGKNFETVGVYDVQDLQKKVTEQCNQMEPPVRAVFTVASVNGLSIVSAEIPAVDVSERPCYYKGTGRVKGSYIRVGDADMPMTDYEIYSFEAFRRHVMDDVRCVERVGMDMLDMDKVAFYIQQKKNNRPQFARLKDEQIYEMLNITQNGVPTLASIMNFGIYPQGIFPQYCITAIVVPGYEIGSVTDEDVRFIDNKRIEGTIDEMVEEAVLFCKRNMKVQTKINSITGMREDVTEYPINAIREAILNAVIHRDYSSYTEGTPIQLNIFTDRIEIRSPGTLYGRMTVEQLGITKPDMRNQTLAVMAETLKVTENRYSGIPTIRNEMKKRALPNPEFVNGRNEFVVTLRNNVSVYRVDYSIVDHNLLMEIDTAYNEDSLEKKIMSYCTIPRSRRELADFLDIKTSFYVMERYVAPMVKEGKLYMTMPDKPKSKNQRYYSKGGNYEKNFDCGR